MKRLGILPTFRSGRWHKYAYGVALLSLAGLTFCWSRWQALPQAAAVPPAASPAPDKSKPTPPSAPERASDYSRRAVAYIHGTQMITREELGEYLIARQGADKLEFLVNKRIIEHACREKGIEISAAEVEAALAADLKELKLPQKDFETRLLKEYRKTLYEWKDDVIWPKLALTRLCQDRVKVEAKDLDNAFQAYYGEKVEGRIIMFPKGEKQVAMKNWPKVRDSEEEFNRVAKTQASPSLAASGGKLPRPIGRNTTGSEEVEKEVFSLQPGEVSKVLETPEGVIIFKCDRRLPADSSVSLESVRATLEKEIFDKKIQAEMPRYFSELRAKAQPKLFLKRYTNEQEWLRDIREELQEGQAGPTKTPPRGN